MEYDLDMYNEDLAISRWVYSKKIKFSNLYEKDDLIQCSLISLYRARAKYDEERGKYFTFAARISYFAMLRYISKEREKTNNFENLSIDFEYGDFSLADVLSEEFDFDLNSSYEFLLKVCNDVIDCHKSKTFQKIAKLYIFDKKPAQIARELRISRQCVCQYIEKFKKIIQERLKELNLNL